MFVTPSLISRSDSLRFEIVHALLRYFGQHGFRQSNGVLEKDFKAKHSEIFSISSQISFIFTNLQYRSRDHFPPKILCFKIKMATTIVFVHDEKKTLFLWKKRNAARKFKNNGQVFLKFK